MVSFGVKGESHEIGMTLMYVRNDSNAKVGEVPIVRSSDLDLDLPTSDYDLFRRF